MERSLGYRPGLDGVRAVAIGLVLLNHTGLSLFLGGGNGVIVFFVLSGFLITKLMLEEWDRTSTVSIRGFYGRRAVRILPAPTVMLIVLLILSGAMTDGAAAHRHLLKEILLSATYLTNMKPLILGTSPFDDYLGHMWSLAVEEQFYLVWPLLIIGLGLPLRKARSVTRGIGVVAIVIAVVRLGLYYLPGLDPDLASISLFSFDAFALGAGLSWVFHHNTLPRLEQWLARPSTPLLGLAVLFVDLVAGKYTHEISSLFVVYCSLAAAAIIGHLFVAPESRLSMLASLPPVVLIGKLSYSIYLWHNPIWVFVSTNRYPDTPLVVLTAIEWSATVVVVVISYWGIEKPAMRLRKRFVS